MAQMVLMMDVNTLIRNADRKGLFLGFQTLNSLIRFLDLSKAFLIIHFFHYLVTITFFTVYYLLWDFSMNLLNRMILIVSFSNLV